MKSNIFNKICVACLVAVSLSACSDVLDEQPRSKFDPSFFSTETGIEGGLTSLYAHLRYIYGNGYYLNNCETGTDEYTYAQSADGNFKDADLSGVGSMTSTSCRADVLWGAAFPNINTCNGVLENGSKAGIAESLLSEARFFRAFDYFQLVQQFGGVPLDLGAGELKFNTSTVRTSKRNTVPEVYTKCIFPDLLASVANLPDNPRVSGAVTKNVARLFLAKAYLTYGWWLQNPNGIPTFPECARTDPDGHDANWYFQQAYDVANAVITNPGPYKLQPTFYDVNVADNDHNNPEVMLAADHDEDEKYGNGGVGYGWGSGGSPENFAYWMETWNYTLLRAKDPTGADTDPVGREAVQGLGRPWTRMAPVADVFIGNGAFAEAATLNGKDSRLDASFTLSYHINIDKAGKSFKYVQGANGAQIKAGEILFSFVPESEAASIDYSANACAVGAGTLPGRPDFVVGFNNISRFKYPINWKIGISRSDNNGSLGSKVNGGSPRPWVIAKFSEIYLIAAEAAVKLGKNDDAVRLVKVLRERAGKWRWCQNQRAALVADYSADLVAATPSVITIDYILDERMREFFGEGYRWFDLARTQTWAERAGTYRIAGSDAADRDLKSFTRSIPKEYYLRPIPQGQLDGLEMTDEEKKEYQNPAYRN